MLRLKRLEVRGFGPFADAQTLDFPASSGVTVVYGENMRGKTSLLNAIRYAFFGTVLGRGSRARRLHQITNRDLAAQGEFGFSVALTYEFDGDEYELVRSCRPRVSSPHTDADYEQSILLRRGTSTLGPQERDRALHLAFPQEISRFFLFDGELLQEYEELLINESDAGVRISEAIERILGVPILKRGRAHLTGLADKADAVAAREASRHQATQAAGAALEQATEQKAAHQAELERLRQRLAALTDDRAEAERFLQSVQRYAGLLQERDEAEDRLKRAATDEVIARGSLQRAMADAWRALLRQPVRTAREAAQLEAERELGTLLTTFRIRAAENGHCGTCDQDVTGDALRRLSESLPPIESRAGDPIESISDSVGRLAALNRFADGDNAGEVRQLWERIADLTMDQVTLKDRISDLNAQLSEADPDSIRRTKASYADVIEKLAGVRQAIEGETAKIAEQDQSILRLQKTLEGSGSLSLVAAQGRATTLRSAAAVLSAAVDEYKQLLRSRVEASASEFFTSMTTEKEDYAGLTINENYGLTIRHRDGQAEEARSAGAEHVVALALMGALQNNAPLRGPIVMDSPFGRLDEGHTANVIDTLPLMAEQVVLLVYESEVGRSLVRDRLGASLAREYVLERVSSRRTNIVEVR
ncbi:MAG TPA: AAA family ATPase [Microbacteriaceae bacterium]|jgi:DNA sulfur modification protein DndD|nr:AAA family ATPase [Microbacteriaceae bacterium]